MGGGVERDDIAPCWDMKSGTEMRKMSRGKVSC